MTYFVSCVFNLRFVFCQEQADLEDARAALPAMKRAKTNVNPLCQLQNLEILQDCKNLPFVMALSSILIEICDEKDPKMLTNILEIANQVRKLKISKLQQVFNGHYI